MIYLYIGLYIISYAISFMILCKFIMDSKWEGEFLTIGDIMKALFMSVASPVILIMAIVAQIEEKLNIIVYRRKN